MALEFEKKDTYLALIRNSVGSKLFDDVYFYNNSDEEFEGIAPRTTVNVTKGGQLSCPYFVSGILHLVDGTIDAPHVTVDGTIKAMAARGWQQLKDINDLQPGDVVVWERCEPGEAAHYVEGHMHIGFILDKNTAVSTSGKQGQVIAHDPYFRNMGPDVKERKIVKVFAHPELSDRKELHQRLI